MTARTVGRILLGSAMVGAGVLHLTTQRAEFQAQVPSWFPLDEDLTVVASGVVEMYYGAPLNQAAWQMSTDVVLSSPTGPQLGGATRLYGLVDGGDLGWVEERVKPDHGLVPHMSARLRRVAG